MKHRASIGVFLTLLGIIAIVSVLPTVGFSQVPQEINYQGHLAGSGGDPVPDGDYNMIFAIYDAPIGGTESWSMSQPVTVAGGVYNVILDIGNIPPQPEFFDRDLYLGVTVDTDAEMTPRQKFTSTPFAMKAAVADSVKDGVIWTIHLANSAVTSEKIADESVTSAKIADGTITASDIDDGSGSGLDADTLDGLDSGAFLLPGSDYGRNGVANNLYEGTTTLTNKYVNKTGDNMTGPLTALGVSGYAAGASGRGVQGYASNTGDVTNFGGYFEALGNHGRAVHGQATNEGAGTNYGGTFHASSSSGMGVGASASGTNGRGVDGFASNQGVGTNYGGRFIAAGSTGRGVYGEASNNGNYTNYGGYFTTAGISGTGVYSIATNDGPLINYGGYFVANGSLGIGVHSEAMKTGAVAVNGIGGKTGVYGEGVTFGVGGKATNEGAGTNYGGHFSAAGSTGRGVYGEASNSGSYMNYGGYFTASGKYGRGVEAIATGTEGTNHGGVFIADGSTGRGVYGEASGASGTGIKGAATNDGSVTNYGGYFAAEGLFGRGVYGYATGSSGIGVEGYGNWYDFYATGPGDNFIALSSIRWKQNIQEIEGALELVMQMRGIYFDWDEEHGGHHDMGFVAEEVGEYVPEVVGFELDSDYANGMDYGKMTPILLEAMKEQQGIIADLRSEMEALKEEIAAIKKGL